MKKAPRTMSLVILLIIVALGLCGCGQEKEEYEIQKGAQKATKSAVKQMSETEKQMHNTQFSGYEGEVSSGNVKTLIFRVLANNGDDNNTQVKLEGITDISDVKENKIYNVKMEKDQDGLISVITIEEK